VASYAVAVGSPAQRPEDSPSDLSSAQTGDTPAAEEQGQDALATERQGRDAPAAAEPGPDAGSGGPALTVERRGRLLVLTYGAGTAGGALAAGANPRKETPGFVVFQGLRPIAVGKFEYG